MADRDGSHFQNAVFLRGEVTAVHDGGEATIFCGEHSVRAYLPSLGLKPGDNVSMTGEMRDMNAVWILSARRLNGTAE